MRENNDMGNRDPAILVHITWVNLEDYGKKVGSVRYSSVISGGRDSTKIVYNTISSLLQSTVKRSFYVAKIQVLFKKLFNKNIIFRFDLIHPPLLHFNNT